MEDADVAAGGAGGEAEGRPAVADLRHAALPLDHDLGVK